MTPYYADDWLTVYAGDCRAVMAEMPEQSVHCVVTSPPYWGLRDYGTATWVGGDEACEHTAVRRPGPDDKSFTNGGTSRDKPRNDCRLCGAVRVDGQIGLEPTPEAYVETMVAVFREVRRVLRDDGTVWLNLGDSYAGSGKGAFGTDEARDAYRPKVKETYVPTRSEAPTAGVVPAGLKPKDLVGIPWRVAFALQADGWVLRSEVIWGKPNPMPESVTDRPTKSHEQVFMLSKGKWVGPERGRFADISDSDARWLAMFLDTEGSIVAKRVERKGRRWYGAQISFASTSRELVETARSIVGQGTILTRPGLNAPMHYYQLSNRAARDLLYRVYPFLIVKAQQARVSIAIQDRLATKGRARPGGFRSVADDAWLEAAWLAGKDLNHFGAPDIAWAPEPEYGRWTSQPYYFDADAVREDWADDRRGAPGGHKPAERNRGGRTDGFTKPALDWIAPEGRAGRNLRSVWTIATQPYPGAHFATFPEALVEPCVKAGTSERGVCPDCGAPWVREVRREGGERYATGKSAEKNGAGLATAFSGYTDGSSAPTFITTGWRPSCRHDAEPVPATVLDPFAGSGTTGRVAQRLGRRAVLIDLNPAYLVQALKRNGHGPDEVGTEPMFDQSPLWGGEAA